VNGLLVIDKPSEWTSHDVVGRSRRILNTRKIGHAGTLDPMATGVLVLGVGRATRLLGFISGSDKSYSATIRLGQSTITDDAEGEVIEHELPEVIAEVKFSSVLAGIALLTGDIDQVPSSVSAIKVDGQRAYAKVRAGAEVHLKPRRVHIREFTAGEHRLGEGYLDVDVEVVCSSGTYIRALARDLGNELGIGGHLTALRRSQVGPWTLTDAISLEALGSLESPQAALMSIEEAAARVFPTWTVSDDDAGFVRNGRRIDWSYVDSSEPVIAIFDKTGTFLALAEQHGPTAKYLAVFV
jgi:tRNA pseudouridine55 synthase